MSVEHGRGGGPVEVEDRANVLVVEEYPVASVIEWRDVGNFTCVLFASHLNDELLARLRERPELLEGASEGELRD